MKLLNLSKYTLTTVLCSSLLTTGTTLAAPTPSDYVGQSGSSFNKVINYGSSIWTSMGKSFNLKVYTDNPRVQQQIQVLVKNKTALYKLLQQAGPTISYVYQQMKQRGLPTELALLPYVESRFNPQAKSPVGASGLWQLMPKTATGLGIKTAANYDGCKDIVASTDAAMNYLVQLGQTFNRDWYLALAAYNWGPGNVRKAARKQTAWYKRSNYWSMKMPKETQDYVPKLLALAEVIKNPSRYGVTLPPINKGQQLATIKVAGKVDFKKISNSTTISMDTMRNLNPGYTKAQTTPGAPNTLLVPIEKAEEVKPLVTVLHSSTDAIPDDGAQSSSDDSSTSSSDDNSNNSATDSNDSAADSNDGAADDNNDATTNNDDTNNGKDQAQANATDDTQNNVHLVKTMLKEGKWLLLTLANIPGSDSIINAS